MFGLGSSSTVSDYEFDLIAISHCNCSETVCPLHHVVML